MLPLRLLQLRSAQEEVGILCFVARHPLVNNMNSVGAAHAPDHALIQPRHPPHSAVEVLRAKPEPPVAAPAPIPAAAEADAASLVADTHCRNPADNTGIAVAADAAIVAVVGTDNKGNKPVPIDYTSALIDYTPAPIDCKPGPIDHTTDSEMDRTVAKSSLDFDVADTSATVVDAAAIVPLVDIPGTVAAVALLRERSDPLILVFQK